MEKGDSQQAIIQKLQKKKQWPHTGPESCNIPSIVPSTRILLTKTKAQISWTTQQCTLFV